MTVQFLTNSLTWLAVVARGAEPDTCIVEAGIEFRGSKHVTVVATETRPTVRLVHHAYGQAREGTDVRPMAIT